MPDRIWSASAVRQDAMRNAVWRERAIGFVISVDRKVRIHAERNR